MHTEFSFVVLPFTLCRSVGCLGQLCSRLWRPRRWRPGRSFSFIRYPAPGNRVPPEVCSSHKNGKNFREQVEAQEDIMFLAQKLHTSTYMPLVKMGSKLTPGQAMEKSTLSSFGPHKGMDAKRRLELGSVNQYTKQYSSFLCS